jgi:hypothetical protein
MAEGKRRSDRIMLTVRLRIVGDDDAGKRFKADARAITLNRHGARIRTLAALRAGQALRLIHLVGNSDGEFRVVGPLAPPSEHGGEWGVECLNPDHNIWGIKFPPLPDGTSAYAKGLLECHRCHTDAFLRLSVVQVEVLETAGILIMPCETCGTESPWGYAESKLALDCSPREARLFAEARAHVEGGGSERDGRQHRRVALQLPVLIRDYYGGTEIGHSENVSKGGFCFTSERTYYVGQGIAVACPYHPTGESIEVAARFARAREIRGTPQMIYGVHYEAERSENEQRKPTAK